MRRPTLSQPISRLRATLEEHEWEIVNMPTGGLPYEVPDISDNKDGWGPTTVPARLEGIPFAPFSKSDKLGRAADWTNQNYQKYSGEAALGGEVRGIAAGRRRADGRRRLPEERRLPGPVRRVPQVGVREAHQRRVHDGVRDEGEPRRRVQRR